MTTPEPRCHPECPQCISAAARVAAPSDGLREAATTLTRLWFDLAGPEGMSATYAALVAGHDETLSEAMWSLRAALATTGQRETPAATAPEPHRARLWGMWSAGEKLAYGCGHRDGRAAAMATLVATAPGGLAGLTEGQLLDLYDRSPVGGEQRAAIERILRPRVLTQQEGSGKP